jgi:UDP-glucose 4-epimerase
VLQMLDTVERVTGQSIRRRISTRRSGDPANVVADPSAVAAALGWRARRGLDEIVTSAAQS